MDKMQKLGELLRESRENKKITTYEASSGTKIRESMIIALEKGDYKLFTSDTHLKSFIKAYSKFLGINEEKAIAMYRRERMIVEETTESLLKKTKSDFNIAGKLAKILNWPAFSILIGLTLITVIIYFFYIQIQAFYIAPRLEIIAPRQNSIIENEVFVIEGITDSISVKVVVDGNQANFIDSQGRFRVNGKFNQPGAKRFTISAENEFRKKSEINLDLIYTPRQSIILKQKIKFFNKSKADIKFSYTTDNKLIFEIITIKPQESSELDFDSKIMVRDFDISKLDIYLNGSTNPLSSISSKGFTVEIENSIPIIKTN